MVFHGNKWGWRTAAARLLLAPVIAVGVATPAVAQTNPPAVRAQASTKADPKDLLKMGREALKAGDFDRAHDLARQADAANAGSRWGLFDDTPDSLEKDIRTARGKAEKADAVKFTKQAKELFAKAATLTPNERMSAFDQAYSLADKAVALQGSTDFIDDMFGGDRPDKLKKEIEAARIQLRKTLPAGSNQVPTAKFDRSIQQTAASEPAKSMPAPVVPATSWSLPAPTGPASPSMPATPATAVTPAAPAAPSMPVAAAGSKVQAAKLVAEGRTLLKQNMLVEARAKALDGVKLNATFAATDDTPEALHRDVMADGKKQIDELAADADARMARKEMKGAEAALGIAVQIATGLGLPTRTLDEKLAMARGTATTVTAAVAQSEPKVGGPGVQSPDLVGVTVPQPEAKLPTTPAVTPPSAPAVTAPNVPVVTVPSVAAPVVPTPELTSPMIPAPAAIPGAVPTLPVPAAPLAPTVPTNPVVSAPANVPAPSGLAMPPVVSAGRQLLAQAEAELRKGDLEIARKLATQAFNGDPTAKTDAQALLRMIDAEGHDRKRKDSAASFQAAVEAMAAKQYDQALGVFKLLDPAMLTPEQKAKLTDLTTTCMAESAKQRGPVAVQAIDVPGAAKPTTPPATSGLSDQVKALTEVEFQKLRSEGHEAESKAKEAFARGETDLAIQMLTDFAAKVKASNLTASRQGLLTSPVERRLESFRIMKRQMDFYTKEAKDKRDSRDKVVGKSLAEEQKRTEIGKKVAEVHDLIKGHKYRDAEMLALQVKNMDPDDPTLAAVYELSKRQRRIEDYQHIKDDKEKMFLEGMNDAERTGKFLGIDNPIEINKERTLNALRRGTGSDLYQRTMSAAERDIELRLDKPLTIEFEQKPLREVISTLRTKTGLNISVDDAAIADEQIALESVMVTEALKDTSVRNVLTLLLDKGRLKFVVENDVIRITTEKKAKGRMYVKVFSVMDLVTPIPDFALADHQSFAKGVQKATNPMPAWTGMGPGGGSFYNPQAGLNGGTMVGGGSNWAGPQANNASGGGNLQNQQSPLTSSATLAATPRQNMSSQLMKLITGMVRPYSWQDMGGPGKLEYYDIGGALVVNQTADVVSEVESLLRALRALQETSVAVEIRIISLSEAFFERVGIDFSMNVQTKNRSGFEQSLTTGSFRPEPFINSVTGNGTTVGYNPSAGGFTPDLNVPIRSTSFPLSSPPFGGYQQLPANGAGGLSVGLAFLNDIQVYMFMEAAQGDRRVNIMQAPKITLFNGQTSTVFVSDVAFFTLGLQVINVGGQFVYVPQNTPIPIGNAFSTPVPGQTGGTQPGVSVTVQAIVSSDKRFVRMNLAPTLTALTSATVPLFPVTAFITPVFEGGSQGVPIPFTQFFQQPSISEINVQTTVAVPDGGTVVLGGLKTLAEGRNEFGPPVLSSVPYLNRLFRNQGIGRETRHIMIMVTPRIIIQSEEEFNQTGVSAGGTGAPSGIN